MICSCLLLLSPTLPLFNFDFTPCTVENFRTEARNSKIQRASLKHEWTLGSALPCKHEIEGMALYIEFDKSHSPEASNERIDAKNSAQGFDQVWNSILDVAVSLYL